MSGCLTLLSSDTNASGQSCVGCLDSFDFTRADRLIRFDSLEPDPNNIGDGDLGCAVCLLRGDYHVVDFLKLPYCKPYCDSVPPDFRCDGCCGRDRLARRWLSRAGRRRSRCRRGDG